MHFTAIVSAALIGSAVATKGYSPFPLPDGFPSPSPAQIKKIEMLAGGALPGGALPTKLTPAATVTLQLIALNEIFEVAYFTQLLANITDGVKGYNPSDKEYAIKALTAVKNQEELHAAGANAILANAHQKTISPCRYQFPVNSYESAIAFAATFTDVVLSVLPLAQETFAADGGDELGLVPLIGSIIAQEGEQDGWYRYVQAKNPSAAPFLTTSNPVFAFTALQEFIVPGSCSADIEMIGKSIPTLAALNVISGTAAKDTTITFSVKGSVDTKKNSIVYLSGQHLPVTVCIKDVVKRGGLSYFKADFPFASDILSKGLTVAALVKAPMDKQFANAAAVAAASIAGPGLIEV